MRASWQPNSWITTWSTHYLILPHSFQNSPPLRFVKLRFYIRIATLPKFFWGGKPMSIFCIFSKSYFGFLITFNFFWIKNIQHWRIIALIPRLTCNVLCTMYHLTHVACHRSPVICHLSLMPKATATDPPFTNSPTMHSRMVGKDDKNKNKNLN